MANQTKHSLRICSFNCEGFNDSKKVFIKQLLTKTDVMFLQEFWLLDATLHKLQQLSDNFLCTSVSGVEPGDIEHRRFFE